eukprot:6694690-Lingulodinium_polyedra.AAC.1
MSRWQGQPHSTAPWLHSGSTVTGYSNAMPPTRGMTAVHSMECLHSCYPKLGSGSTGKECRRVRRA